ncbi:hypothetical protein HXX76_002821 [Chlamydomonas incerta]|uniref:Uncharacterized protein n=1 Tax=Chlamydomonas incerta TaxID=51695 RepID=A0A835W996_CHLIN|nr:hypothetical protein HXX76_002821 [Chlamydomonas incerta]|eukprot:KAG2442739.1 hypothetical protein HXX76_002821 [Chlamydomonas incerta]
MNGSFDGQTLDEDVLFKVDDVAASPSLADAWNAVPPTPNASGQDLTAPRAYSRAVCLSFGGNAAAATPAAKPSLKEEGGLELKVQQLVADFTLPAAAQQLHIVLLMEQLAVHLRSAGLAAEVMSPPSPDQRSPLTTRSIRDPFLVVSAESAFSDVDGASDVSKEIETVIVDAALFAHLALAPATPAYLRTLRSMLPGPVSPFATDADVADAVPVFTVVARARLVSLVKSLAPAVSLNFSSHGMEVPPWRRTPALLRRWEPAEKLEQRLALQAKLAAEGDDAADSGSLWGSAASEASAPASPVVPVFGFAVVAETASAWATPAASEEEAFGPAAAAASPAVLASLFRRVSSANSEASASDAGSAAASDAGNGSDSEDEDEDVIFGLSPVSLSGLVDEAEVVECDFQALKA